MVCPANFRALPIKYTDSVYFYNRSSSSSTDPDRHTDREKEEMQSKRIGRERETDKEYTEKEERQTERQT
jgi:hypothetical protein